MLVRVTLSIIITGENIQSMIGYFKYPWTLISNFGRYSALPTSPSFLDNVTRNTHKRKMLIALVPVYAFLTSE